LGIETLSVSAETRTGLADLRQRLERRIVADLAGAEFPAATRQRHEALLRQSVVALESASMNLSGQGVARLLSVSGLARLEPGPPEPELAAEDLRLAARALERITGRIGAEDILDVIFASFCIGK